VISPSTKSLKIRNADMPAEIAAANAKPSLRPELRELLMIVGTYPRANRQARFSQRPAVSHQPPN
jgi:hypothetical protein